MTDTVDTQPEVIRNYKAARRFPQVVGRFPDGKRIPGGPYTVVQVVGFFAVLGLLYLTRSVWMVFGVGANLVVAAAPLLVVVFVLGRVRPDVRNPVTLAVGLARAATAPRIAKIDGRPVRRRRPRNVAASGHIYPVPDPRDREQ
jgi:hypothetical protein